MTPTGDLPRGFHLHSDPPVRLIAREDCASALVAAGLDRPEGWSRHLAASRPGAGRGRTARLRLSQRSSVVLKQMRRGGMTRAVWRDRYAGKRRLIDNLRIPLEAARRGVSTAAPVALLLVEGPPFLFRAWLAVEEIPDTENLIERIQSRDPLVAPEIATVIGLIRRMHDRGVEHRDLNLGNLLVRRQHPDEIETFVVDLDRARLRDRPLRWRERIRGVRRLERSTVKLFGERPRIAGLDLRRCWYEAYAAGDVELSRRLDRARRANRLWLRLHGLGWR